MDSIDIEIKTLLDSFRLWGYVTICIFGVDEEYNVYLDKNTLSVTTEQPTTPFVKIELKDIRRYNLSLERKPIYGNYIYLLLNKEKLFTVKDIKPVIFSVLKKYYTFQELLKRGYVYTLLKMDVSKYLSYDIYKDFKSDPTLREYFPKINFSVELSDTCISDPYTDIKSNLEIKNVKANVYSIVLYSYSHSLIEKTNIKTPLLSQNNRDCTLYSYQSGYNVSPKYNPETLIGVIKETCENFVHRCYKNLVSPQSAFCDAWNSD